MAATDHLGQQFMYHVSPVHNRESIQASGLDKRYSAMGPRVYLSDHEGAQTRARDGYDIWKVDVTGVPTREDRVDEGSARYAQRSIAPGRLSLHTLGS
jgi:hypothetical protein